MQLYYNAISHTQLLWVCSLQRGETALFSAARMNRIEVAKFLLSHRADISISDYVSPLKTIGV